MRPLFSAVLAPPHVRNVILVEEIACLLQEGAHYLRVLDERGAELLAKEFQQVTGRARRG
jgi:hypothetical protein